MKCQFMLLKNFKTNDFEKKSFFVKKANFKIILITVAQISN